jgi:HD-like signal output (HDOD) protein
MPGVAPKAEGQAYDLASVAGEIQEVSTLPQIALRVIEVANDASSGAADLKEVMESDVALSARVLRCVNSSAYAVRGKINNLQQAIAYLGMKQIRNLAMTASVSQLFREEHAVGPYRRSQLWCHLVSVGICGRLIAMRLRIQDFEDVFLAGLLHDIGIVLEDQHLHGDFCRMIETLDPNKTLAAAERNTFGFDHTALGQRLAKLWGFPEAAREAIRHHHGSASYRGPMEDAVRCVEVANLICTLKQIPSVGINLVKSCPAALQGLGLDRRDLIVLSEDLDQELVSNRGLFSM